jgi:serine/threonine protein kinase
VTAAAGERWGQYVLEERIASGGMAEVFRARRTGAEEFSKLVCIKRLHRQFSRDGEFVALLLEEARTGSKLRHRNVVAIDDLGEHDGRYFLAMEYVNGVDLMQVEQRLAQAGARIPADVAAFVLAELLAGLSAAHTAVDPDTGRPLNVVHRDVTPHNVMVSFAGEVKLADFGIARAEGRARITADGIVRGKFGYMPLEQATGGAVDARSDLFALGVTMYELLTGRRPFCGDRPDATIEAVIGAMATDDRPRLVALRPDLPPALAHVIERLLAVAPAARYPDAVSALAELQVLREVTSGGFALGTMMATMYPGQASIAVVSPRMTPAPPLPSRGGAALLASPAPPPPTPRRPARRGC